MLYIAYLPKYKGEEKEQRKVNNILKWYAELTREKYSIVAAPGYLSKTSYTIGIYLHELSRLLTDNYNRKIGLLNGMNGHYKITSSQNTIIEEHNAQLSNHSFKQIQLNAKKEYDHRKMMCFFCEKGVGHSEITLKNLDDFFKNVHVGAVLIGSSNQSNTTYFQDCATKGETDIFLIDASDDQDVQIALTAFEQGKRSEWSGLLEGNEDIVITKSFHGRGHYHTQGFLKDILRELLINGLEE